MKLKPTIKGMKNLQVSVKEEVQVSNSVKKQDKRQNKQANKLPNDDYKPMFEPTRFLVKESFNPKDPTKKTKQYMEISVKRLNDDEGLTNVFIQMYQESDFYTGYLKGKSVHVPLEMLYTLIEELEITSEECDKRKIE